MKENVHVRVRKERGNTIVTSLKEVVEAGKSCEQMVKTKEIVKPGCLFPEESLSLFRRVNLSVLCRTIGACLVLLIPFAAHPQDQEYRLLNNKERLDYLREGKSPGGSAVIKDSTGAVLHGFNLQFPVYQNELYAASDYFVDNTGKITEVVVRKPRFADRILIRKLYDFEEEQLRGSLEFVTVDCGNMREILAGVLTVESENIKNGQVIDVEINNQQEATVVSLLRQCAEPTLTSAGTDGIRACVIALQHARRKNQEKYYHVLEGFVKNGTLKKNVLAPVEDRLLITSGMKQKYGTQIVFFARSGYHLFPIEDAGHVDERRAAMGLPPLEQYLKDREEFYGSEIK